MKKQLLILIGILITINTYAQIEITKPIEEYAFNKKTIVNDENGHRCTYANWSKLLAGGKYRLKPIHHDSDSTEFILTRRNETEEDKQFANLPKPEETKFFKSGDAFKFRKITDVNGAIINPEDLSGKIVVINFWFIACPPCRYEMPELNRVVQAYQNNKEVVFIAITLDKKTNVERFLKVSPFNYHVVSDSMSLFYYYGVNECPASIVIDRKGIIRFNSQGYGEGAVPYWIKKTIEEIK
ncbi:TlpA family protein disulfide reductase [Mucilaginibacter sp. OK098]|uniref:TlpA family protein disulfide reductase n=1 Tax=Mucilaginibacter sp. OK098 TaxID=1855297 RepID=UPI00091193CA|nr:TlpA disulfide reductase family protein [Mucilaginibacter sp. OK098]SHN24858.1 Thiol-disulfide isomerase or thioredoxin [Mucilaginibacter sp. OK098]